MTEGGDDPGASADLARMVSAACARASAHSGTDGLSVALVEASVGLSPIWASDQTAGAIEERQITLGEGPCFDVLTSGAPVLVEDLDVTVGGDSWPGFLREITHLGIHGLFAFPLRIGAISLGTLELYRRAPGGLSTAEMGVVLETTDRLGDMLLDFGDAPDDREVIPTFQLSVHQAAGMITVQLDVPIEEAMMRLRSRAYVEGRPINELAADVVARRVRFSEEPS